MLFIILPRAAVSADRVADVLETEPIIRDPQRPNGSTVLFTGTVEFRNVSFRYPGADTRRAPRHQLYRPSRVRRRPSSARPGPANRRSST